jgi:D-methionine transport system ATP-binding protein
MIEIQNLSKIYEKAHQKVVAIEHIDLKVERGDIYGIVGLSGAGKSSLVRCINRIEDPTTGTVIVDGVDLTGLSGKALRSERQKIGMIFQNFNLLSSKTVFENIAFPLRLKGLDKEQIQKRVLDLLEKVELTDKADVYPVNLSGGQKQRVGIARALANEPSVLLCDESTSALDPKTTKQILYLLKRINKEFGVTLVVITHEMDVIKAICNKVAILESGKIIAKGDTIDVFTRRTSDATKHFIGESFSRGSYHKGSNRLQLTFKGESAEKPILSGLIRSLAVDVNILSGSIETIQDYPLGKLIVELPDDPNVVKSALDYLAAKGVDAEVVI